MHEAPAATAGRAAPRVRRSACASKVVCCRPTGRDARVRTARGPAGIRSAMRDLLPPPLRLLATRHGHPSRLARTRRPSGAPRQRAARPGRTCMTARGPAVTPWRIGTAAAAARARRWLWLTEEREKRSVRQKFRIFGQAQPIYAMRRKMQAVPSVRTAMMS